MSNSFRVVLFMSLALFVMNETSYTQNSQSSEDLKSNNNKIDLQNISSPSGLAINELHMVSDSGRSGYPISISYSINNTDQFVGFQFDIILPSVLSFVEDSVWLFRKTNHIIIANQINRGLLEYLLTLLQINHSQEMMVRLLGYCLI